MYADKAVLEGRPGRFSVLDYRSHRLKSWKQQLHGGDMDWTNVWTLLQLRRSTIAEIRGVSPKAIRDGEQSGAPAVAITDAKDAYDKVAVDTSSTARGVR